MISGTCESSDTIKSMALLTGIRSRCRERGFRNSVGETPVASGRGIGGGTATPGDRTVGTFEPSPEAKACSARTTAPQADSRSKDRITDWGRTARRTLSMWGSHRG